MTDQGQIGTSQEDLTKQLSDIAPSVPGLANATSIAPERKASPLPSPSGDVNFLGSPATPGIVISDHPESPATLIPATDGSSTRPTKGGIAYPFSLKVEGTTGVSANASMVTLDSIGITTPPALEPQEAEKELGAIAPVIDTTKEKEVEKEEPVPERPAAERFYTAGMGAGLFSDGIPPQEVDKEEKVERPHVERFETAQEDLSMITNGNGKV